MYRVAGKVAIMYASIRAGLCEAGVFRVVSMFQIQGESPASQRPARMAGFVAGPQMGSTGGLSTSEQEAES